MDKCKFFTFGLEICSASFFLTSFLCLFDKIIIIVIIIIY